MTRLLLALLHLYQRLLSPLLGSRCRFHPSCSDLRAHRRGAVRRGCAAACSRLWRIARCQPFCRWRFRSRCRRRLHCVVAAILPATIRTSRSNDRWLIVNADIVNEGKRFAGDVRIRAGRIDTSRSEPVRAAQRARVRRARTPAAARHDRRSGAFPRARTGAQRRFLYRVARGGRRRHHQLHGNAQLEATDDRLARRSTTSTRAPRKNRSPITRSISARPTTISRRSAPRSAHAPAASRCSWAPRPATCWSTIRTHSTAFSATRRRLIATHCEDTPMIEANLAAERAQLRRRDSGRAPSIHPFARSLHQVHAAGDRAGAAPRHAPARAAHHRRPENWRCSRPARSTASASPPKPVSTFCNSATVDYAQKGNLIKCNPAIKSATRSRCDHRRAERRSHRHPRHRSCPAYAGRKTAALTNRRLPACRSCNSVLQCALERWFDGQLPIETDRREDRARACAPVRRAASAAISAKAIGRILR